MACMNFGPNMVTFGGFRWFSMGMFPRGPSYSIGSTKVELPKVWPAFLDATTHLYKRLCLSIYPSIGWSVRPKLFQNVENLGFSVENLPTT